MLKVYMNSLKSKINKCNIYLFLVICVFAITLIPLIVVSFYNHMYCDDFDYAREASRIISTNESILKKLGDLLANAVSTSFAKWKGWSGCYTSYFFSAIAPYIWGDKYVCLNVFILLGTYIISNLLSFKLVAIDILNLDKKKAWIICFSALFVSVQFVPSTAEAYYWFNGSFYNIVGFSIGLLLFAIILKITFYKKKIKLVLYGILGALLAFFFGGTNYSSILLYMVVYFFLIIYLIFFSGGIEWKRKVLSIYLIMQFYTCSLLSILAPGNSMRQEQVGEHASAFNAVIFSLVNVGQFIRENTNLIILLIIFLTLPFIFSCASEIDISYKYPVIVVMISCLLLAVTFTPTLYALNTLGPKRTYNLYFFFYIILLYLNVFYLCGWISKNIQSRCTENIKKDIFSLRIYGQMIMMTGLILMIGVPIEKYNNIAFVSATASILSGDIKEYDRQIEERHQIYNDSEVEDVVLPRLTVNPVILSVYENEGLSENPDYWVNQIIKNYYEKNSIISISEE